MKNFIVLSVLTALLCCAQQSWEMQTAPGGSVRLLYNGQVILQDINVEAYTPNYSKRNFSFTGAQTARDGQTLHITKGNDFCQTRVTITPDGSSVAIALEADVAENQYLEYGLQLPPQLITQGDDTFQVTYSGQTHTFANGKAVMAPANRFAIELPAVSYEFSNDAQIPFSFQDKRSNMKCFRYIGVGNTIDEGKRSRITSRVVLNVKEFTGAELGLRKARLNRADNAVTQALEISNASFDQGLEGWQHEANATAEFKGAINGQCAKLVVNDPMNDNPYITRLIPCVEGAHYQVSCQIRTENVTAADGKMPSYGACLIVEWADKNGTWMAGGEYSSALFGTNDWTRAVCSNLRAPEGSGYLYIYLAVRGRGTAWFEDFGVTQIEKSVTKAAPENGATLDTNAPAFHWLPMNNVDSYTLELSQDAAFPPAATRRYEIDVETSCQLRDILTPGVWYWRLSAPGYHDRQPWKLTVTVPATRNMVPPLITADHGRVLTPDAPYAFTAEGHVSVAAPDSPAAFTVTANGDHYTAVPANGWQPGLNTVAITARGANGTTAHKTVWVACAPKPEKAVVIDKNGRYSENGRTIFPLGIYEVAEKYMQEVRESGFDVIHSYRWEGTTDDKGVAAYLQACARNGLRCFLGFDRGNSSGNGIVQGNYEHVARRVATFAAHPALFCWYLFDEPEVTRYYVPPKKLTVFAEIVRKLDPYHPVVMTTWGKGMNKYRRTWDTHWTQSGYSTPDEAVRIYTTQYDLLLHDSPITMIIGCYDQAQARLLKNHQPVNWDKFFPDYDCMRANALVGLSKNINGLWWWWYARDSLWMTAAQNPRTWANVQKVIAEVISMRPVLNADAPVQMGTETVGEARIEWWCKIIDGKANIIAVNTSVKDVEATIAPAGAAPVHVKLGRYGCYVNFGNRQHD